jgi:hypothetical protein
MSYLCRFGILETTKALGKRKKSDCIAKSTENHKEV